MAHSGFLGCQRPKAAKHVPIGPAWLFERKYDGYRAQAVVRGSEVRIFTRSGLDWTCEFASVVPAIKTLPVASAVLDGEVCVLDGDDTDFSRLSAGLRAGARLTFLAFDLLELDSCDLRCLPLTERKTRLREVLGRRDQHDQLQCVPYVEADGHGLFDAIRRQGHEGIVCKRRDSAYRVGTSPDWLKIKCIDRQEFAVIGWAPDPMTGEVKSLALATFDEGRAVFRGCVGTGFSRLDRTQIAAALRSQQLGNAAAAVASTRAPKGLLWVQPTLVVELRFRGLSRHGIVREPAFLGLRADKAAKDVTIAT